jgi:hypothetical protein
MSTRVEALVTSKREILMIPSLVCDVYRLVDGGSFTGRIQVDDSAVLLLAASSDNGGVLVDGGSFCGIK